MSRDAAFAGPSPYLGPSSNNGGQIINDNKRSKTAVIILIIIIILLIIAVIIIVWLKSKSTTPTSTTTTATSCTSNFDCSNGQVCNTTKNTCVNCLTKSDCKTSASPLCNTVNNTCVQCISDTDCTESGFTCINSTCAIKCTIAPNVVTNLQITTNSTQQKLTWTPSAAGDPATSYIVSQAANACPSTSAETTNTQTIPFGTNTAIFSGLSSGTYCYVVQSQNSCGTTAFASSPSVQGTVCGTLQSAPSGTATYTLLYSDCVSAECEGFGGPGSGQCTINLNHPGAGPGPLFGDIYMTTNAAIEAGTPLMVLSNNELITSLPADPSYAYSYFRAVACGNTSTLTAQRVNNWIVASRPTITPDALPNGETVIVSNTTVGYTFNNVPANPTVSWIAIAGVDEYAITITGVTAEVAPVSVTFGTIVPSSSTSYTFVGPTPALSTANVFIFGYTDCNTSLSTTLASVTI